VRDRIREKQMKTKEFSKGKGGPLILWGTDLERDNGIEELVRQLDILMPEQAYTLAVFGVEDWNAEFSPWRAEVEGQAFEGKGPETLGWLKDEYIPSLKKKYPDASEMCIAGYSLAGLFALWAAYEIDLFCGCASCSGSLWFPGWTVYTEGHRVSENCAVYLSLGGKEKNNRSAVLATIEDNTKLQLELLKKCVKDVTLEMNPGGHFADPMGRIAKGIAWLVKKRRI